MYAVRLWKTIFFKFLEHMTKSFFFVLFFLVLISGGNAQSIISGKIIDATTKTPLPGATIVDQNSLLAASSNSEGYFHLQSSSDITILSVSYLGYNTDKITVKVSEQKELLIALIPKLNELEEVQVIAHKTDLYFERTGNVIMIPMEQIQKIPALAGERDIMKATQLLPGVQSGMEGSSGIFVRGGGQDQNLILMDDVSLYNLSHLFGFISIFNVDAVQSIQITKAGFPARYGGRLSSVVDIKLKAGDTDSLKGVFSLGIISGKFMLEGPLWKSSTFLLSGRSSYIDRIYCLAQSLNKSPAKNTYLLGLNDLNLKLTQSLSDNHKITFGMYGGNDIYGYENSNILKNKSKSISKENLHWGNTLTYINYNARLSSKIRLKATSSYVNYFYKTLSQQESEYEKTPENNRFYKQTLESHVKDFSSKILLNMVVFKKSSVRAGIQYSHRNYSPNVSAFDSREYGDSMSFQNDVKTLLTHEHALFLESTLQIGTFLKITPGVRMSFCYTDGIKYQVTEPRLAANFHLSENWILKASFDKNAQYLHLLTNNSIGMPLDLWVPVTKNVPAQTSIQYAGSFTHKLNKEKGLVWGIEVYRKQMKGLIDYAENSTEDIQTSDWQSLIETGGVGRMYGAELFLHKEKGRFNGWMSYTYAKSERRFDNINKGNWYPFKYDRRHDFSLTASYLIKKNLEISATWVYASGHAITLPIARFYDVLGTDYEEADAFLYSDRNAERMPAYHRLDVGIQYKKKKKNTVRVWSAGIYNVYNKMNPFYIYLSETIAAPDRATYPEKLSLQFFQRSLFPILPSISYEIHF